MIAKFAEGQTVYAVDGEQLEYVGQVGGKVFVRRHIPGCYDDGFHESLSEPYPFHGELFAEAPVGRYNRDVENAVATLKTLRSEIAEHRGILAELECKIIDVEATAKKHEDFRMLIDYLEGRITHVILPNYSHCRISELDEILSGKDNYSSQERWPRALGLFALPNAFAGGGRYGKKVTWSVNSYGDGSGNWSNFIPCRGEEEAREIVKAAFHQALEDWRADKARQSCHEVARFLQNNDWLEVPQDWIDYVEDQRLKELEERRAYLITQLAELDSEARRENA